MVETDRKELILDTFIRLVGRFGIDKTNLQDIAKEMGISVGSIYQLYNNKDTLVKAGLLRLSERFIADCTSVIDQDLPPEELLHDFIRRILIQMNAFITENRGFYQYVKEEGFLGRYRNKTVGEDFNQQLLSLLSTVLKRGVAEGTFKGENIEKNAELVLDAFYVFFVQLILFDRNIEDILADVQMMYNILLYGIKKRKDYNCI